MNEKQNRRVVKTPACVALVISTMVGTGIFTTTGLMAGMGARGGDILLAWLIGGILALCGSLCYGELGANMPESGGEYHYIHRLLHPSLGFLSGWVSIIVGFAAPIAAVTMAMHIYLAQVITGWPIRLMTVLTIIILSLLHAYDLRLGARLQIGFLILKIVLICAFIAGVLITGPGADPLVLTDITPSFWFQSSYAVILIYVAFAYSGWNAAAYIGAEIANPAKVLPRSLILGTLIVTGLYLLINYAYFSAVPLETLINVESIAHIVGTSLWGSRGGVVVSLLIAAGLVATTSAMIITGPRVVEAMANDRLFPRALAKLNQRNVPSRAVVLQAVLAIIFALTATFSALLVYIGFTLSIFAALAVLSMISMRIKGLSSIRVCWGYPLTPIIFLAFTIWMTVWSIHSRPISTISGLGTLVIGYLIYLIQKQKINGPSAEKP
jgi:APA family basic amino acid/polyamine antiporter